MKRGDGEEGIETAWTAMGRQAVFLLMRKDVGKKAELNRVLLNCREEA